jgi:hypothetical protein
VATNIFFLLILTVLTISRIFTSLLCFVILLKLDHLDSHRILVF